jgi:hypothetical protein
VKGRWKLVREDLDWAANAIGVELASFLKKAAMSNQKW